MSVVRILLDRHSIFRVLLEQIGARLAIVDLLFELFLDPIHALEELAGLMLVGKVEAHISFLFLLLLLLLLLLVLKNSET